MFENVFAKVVASGVMAIGAYHIVASKPATISFRLPVVKAATIAINKNEFVNFSTIHAVGLSKVNISYLGFQGDIPSSRHINWNVVLRSLWATKLHIKGVSGATKSAYSRVVNRYVFSPEERMTINQHLSRLRPVLDVEKKNIRWNDVCHDYHIGSIQCVAFVRSAKMIDAEQLTSHSMTELMPYRKGTQNYALMNLYMSNAGRNFLDSIPALGDTYLSVGRYQFTSYAIGHDVDGLRPVNKLAKYSNKKISQSVVTLKGIDSDRAAYYFAVFNVMNLTRMMSDKQATTYNRSCISRIALGQYIATAHHNPKMASRNALAWINGKCAKPLLTYQGKSLKIYAEKTITNYQAIIKNER